MGLNVQYQVNKGIKLIKETENSKNKAINKNRNDSIKNMLQKNNLSFVHQESNEDKPKVDYLAINKSAVKKNNCRTEIFNGKYLNGKIPISKNQSERDDSSFKSNTSTAKKSYMTPNDQDESTHSTLKFRSKKAKLLLNSNLDHDLNKMPINNTPEWALSKQSTAEHDTIVKDDVLKI